MRRTGARTAAERRAGSGAEIRAACVFTFGAAREDGRARSSVCSLVGDQDDDGGDEEQAEQSERRRTN